MKKINFLTFILGCLCSIATVSAQTVSLTFTGRDATNRYVQLNKVVVTNLTKSWQETIYWPDTVLNLTNKTGISDVQEQEIGLFSYPNPFNGTSSVLLTIPQSQEVYMAVYNITGQRVMEFSSQLEAGTNHFDIGFQKPQAYFLVVNTLEGRLVQKLVNVGHSGDNYVKFRSTLPLLEEQTSKTQKRQSSQPFSYGDMMEYVGYATINGNMEESQRILQAQGNSQTFILQFDVAKATLPTLNTTIASNITSTSAVSGGNITNDGGVTITARGICWSTSSNPTINESHTTDGSGKGRFTSNITGLTAGRTYYVRAYATNIAGTAYGAQISFTTKTTPTLTTIIASNITDTSAVSGGNITNDGGATITARGTCWSTSSNPTINDNHTTNGSGTGSFTSNMTGLTAGTTYYVRAYATNIAGTAYGAQISFVTSTALPILTTLSVSNITSTTATSGGNITSDGGATITARGICWSTSPNPTINDSHTTNGSGTGSFTSNITGLTAGRTYYVRAYATNRIGTAYGVQISFVTSTALPVLTTLSVSNITDSSAVSGGNIISDGGASITARGICWDTISNPTINNNHTTNGLGIGSFTSNMTGLTAGRIYYVRAYATNSVGTIYGNQVSFYTATVVLNNAKFSVSPYQKVVFSPGNLQWSATNGGNTPTTHIVALNHSLGAGTWRFAPQQWDTIGAGNKNIDSTYTGWIDLFGWGTSGYNNLSPYMKYGNYIGGIGNNNMSGTYYDWGVYNAIYNPRTQTTDTYYTWRTLTKQEWEYLLDTRSTVSSVRYAKGTVWGIAGVIIVPDNWVISIYALDSTNTSSATYTSNVINPADWVKMENAGCIFLPAAGIRTYGTTVGGVGSYGYYWSSTNGGGSSDARYMYFNSSSLYSYSPYGEIRYGRSVRLVRDVEYY